jgi:hypothetical protein
MTFDWNDYITLAEDLIKNKPGQAQLRSATSRAYYAAFIKCRNRSPYNTVKGGDVHFKVISFYKREEGSREEFSIGYNLDALRVKRNESDYDSRYFVKTGEVANHIKLARLIVESLQKLEME